MTLLFQDRVLGSVLGLACGDAVGAPVEMKDSNHCLNYIENVLKPRKFNKAFRTFEGPFIFGQYTDDTELSLALMHSIYSCNGQFDPADFANKLQTVMSAGIVVGSGSSIKNAAAKLANGVSWLQSGTPAPRAGNGSAMRAAPIGYLYASSESFDEQAFIMDAHLQGYITHRDPRSIGASILVAGSVALIMQGDNVEDPVSRAMFLQRLANWVKPFDKLLSTVLTGLDLWSLEFPNAFALIDAYRDLEVKSNWPGISPFARTTVLWALYSFLNSPRNFEQTIYTALSPGGDVDSTASIAGAMSGAYNGINYIPSTWINALHSLKEGHKDVEYLENEVVKFCSKIGRS